MLASSHAAIETEVASAIFAGIEPSTLLQAVAPETIMIQIAVVIPVMIMVIIVLRLIGLRRGYSIAALLGILDPAFARKRHLMAD